MRNNIFATFACCALATVVFADEETRRAADAVMMDCPLYEAPDYTDDSCVLVRFTVLEGSGMYFFMNVSLERLDVQLRTAKRIPRLAVTVSASPETALTARRFLCR